MIATALSRLPNDRTNERTAATIALVSAGALVFALCIMYSCLCFVFRKHTLTHSHRHTHTHTHTHTHGAGSALEHVKPFLTFPHRCLLHFLPPFLSFTPQQGDASNEGRLWPKERGDHYHLYPSSRSMTSLTLFHLLLLKVCCCSSLQLFLFPFPISPRPPSLSLRLSLPLSPAQPWFYPPPAVGVS